MPFLKENKFTFFLLLIFLSAIALVWPTGNFPLNDDWAYSKSVLILTREHKLDIGEWGAMTLVTHLLWGAAFVKVFGFSLFVLRLSTLVSSFIGILFLYKTVKLLTGNKSSAFFAALCLLFYPLYFCLSNTYMTDVNFNTLMILGIYCIVQYHKNFQKRYLLFIFLISVAIVLLRQFGILLPLSFVLSCLFIKEHRLRSILFSFVIFAGVYAIFAGYEHYLRSALTYDAAYKFSGSLELFAPSFYTQVWARYLLRWKLITVHLFLFSLPLSFPLLLRLFMQQSPWVSVLSLLLSSYIAIKVFGNTYPLHGNVFSNMSLGTETWYESLTPRPREEAHTYSTMFGKILEVVRFLAITTGLSCCLLIVFRMLLSKNAAPLRQGTFIFLVVLFSAYIASLLVAESYFDRYQIPLISILLIAGSVALNKAPKQRVSYPAGIIILLIYSYVSVAGVKDYFSMNETKWKAFHEMQQEADEGEKINAGFEVNCWNNGEPLWWANVLITEPYTYLIQYNPEKQFRTIKKYPFKRYFPPGRDTVIVMKKDSL